MKLFGLIGYPLGHSSSKEFWNRRFAEKGLDDHRYENFPLERIEGFPDLLKVHPELCGLNVTIPHKERIIPFLDELSPGAAIIGAVNTIAITEGRTKGYNTDAPGFKKSIRPLLKSHHERALILGTGGASKAVDYALKQIGLENYFVSRKHSDDRTFKYDDLTDAHMEAFKLIVNCTPVGMAPREDEMPPIPLEPIGQDHLIVDLIYNPSTTKLLSAAAARGAQTLNGEDMLRFQAEESWEVLVKDG